MSGQKKTGGGGGGGGWGSVFTSAITNLESRLDHILADESELAAKQRLEAEKQANGNRSRASSGRLAVSAASSSLSSALGSDPGSRDASRTRVNDKLAERLAKATAQKVPSRGSTPVNDAGSARLSSETNGPADIAKLVPNIEVGKAAEFLDTKKDLEADEQEENTVPVGTSTAEEPAALRVSTLSIDPAPESVEISRPSTEAAPQDRPLNRPCSDMPNGSEHAQGIAAQLQVDMEQMRSDHAKAETERQEEMHAYLERIDALQAKLTYLAKETVAAAKVANASAGAGSLEKQLAEKDERIALLMEEGQQLSKNEMKHLQTIKKLRATSAEHDRVVADLRRRLDRAETSEADLVGKLRKAEATERQANEKNRQFTIIEKQLEELKTDHVNATELVRSLTTQLKEAHEKASKAESNKRSAEAAQNKIAELQNELEDAQIEKKLAEDRAISEIRKAKEDAQRRLERFSVTELELKSEISGLETRLEALRARAEDARDFALEGESSVKLIRQVETLQQQYALAKGNWETIEGSLNARVANLEKDRDEISKRESDLRKKARDASNKSRRAEEELEASLDRVRNLEQGIRTQQDQILQIQSKLEQAELMHAEARADLDTQRKLWESEASQRLEEEKLKWRREMLGSSSQAAGSPRPESLATFVRKGSGTDVSSRRPAPRYTSHDLTSLHNLDQRPVSRRGSAMPTSVSARANAPSSEASPSISRRESTMSFENQNMPPTPSIEIGDRISEDGDPSSPQRTINDLLSTSTAGPGVGPSVQLVERMSSLVRKLESEKASFRDELTRLSAQRDDARNEVIELIREVETKRSGEVKVAELEKDMQALQKRYDASLEMLGEREEEVEELKEDMKELKRLYKELANGKFTN